MQGSCTFLSLFFFIIILVEDLLCREQKNMYAFLSYSNATAVGIFVCLR